MCAPTSGGGGGGGYAGTLPNTSNQFTITPINHPPNRFVHRRQSATAAGVHPIHMEKAVKLGLVLPGDGPLDRSTGGVSGSGRVVTTTTTTTTTTAASFAASLFGTGSVDLAALGHLDRARADSFSSEEAGSSDDGEGGR